MIYLYASLLMILTMWLIQLLWFNFYNSVGYSKIPLMYANVNDNEVESIEVLENLKNAKPPMRTPSSILLEYRIFLWWQLWWEVYFINFFENPPSTKSAFSIVKIRVLSVLVCHYKNFQVEWSNICLDALNNVDRFYQGKDTADIIHGKVIQVCFSVSLFLDMRWVFGSLTYFIDVLIFPLYSKILKGKNEDMKQLFGKELKSGDLSGIHAECLTDTWIGKDRFSLSLSLSLSHTHTHTHKLTPYAWQGLISLQSVTDGHLLI